MVYIFPKVEKAFILNEKNVRLEHRSTYLKRVNKRLNLLEEKEAALAFTNFLDEEKQVKIIKNLFHYNLKNKDINKIIRIFKKNNIKRPILSLKLNKSKELKFLFWLIINQDIYFIHTSEFKKTIFNSFLNSKKILINFDGIDNRKKNIIKMFFNKGILLSDKQTPKNFKIKLMNKIKKEFDKYGTIHYILKAEEFKKKWHIPFGRYYLFNFRYKKSLKLKLNPIYREAYNKIRKLNLID